MISSLLNMIVGLLELAIIVHVLLSYFLAPYHPIRETLNRIVEPLLEPIRRVVPTIGAIDFSPLILLIAIQIVGQLLARLFVSLGL